MQRDLKDEMSFLYIYLQLKRKLFENWESLLKVLQYTIPQYYWKTKSESFKGSINFDAFNVQLFKINHTSIGKAQAISHGSC